MSCSPLCARASARCRLAANLLNPCSCLRCRHTSGRSWFRPEGNAFPFVAEGNLFANRTVLFIRLAAARGLRWIMEQPQGSIMKLLPRFQELPRYMTVACPRFFREDFRSELDGDDPSVCFFPKIFEVSWCSGGTPCGHVGSRIQVHGTWFAGRWGFESPRGLAFPDFMCRSFHPGAWES